MIQLFHPLLTLIATASDSLLARYVLYLKNENRILRDRIPGEIHTKPHERTQLLKYGQPLGTAINELITIVTPGTFHRWVREEKRGRKKKPIGRPGKSAVLRAGRHYRLEGVEFVLELCQLLSWPSNHVGGGGYHAVYKAWPGRHQKVRILLPGETLRRTRLVRIVAAGRAFCLT